MFQAVTVLDLESGRFFQVLVDLDDGQVEDRAAIEEAEEQRHRAKYGKLQPALYERLRGMGEDETVTVTIWVAALPGKSLTEQQAAAFATLAARYPQEREAMERSGKPMDVDDPTLTERIYDEYVQILNAEVASRIQPLVETLEAQGFAVRTAEGLPAVTVTLPRRAIKELGELCQRHDKIFIVDAISILAGDELPVDEWKVDLCIAGSQKCLACPPGVSMVSVSERAYQVLRENKHRPFYFDLESYRSFAYERMETPFTPVLTLFYALDEALKFLREKEARTKAIYRELYGFKLGEDLSPFHLIIDVNLLSKDEVFEALCMVIDRLVLRQTIS